MDLFDLVLAAGIGFTLLCILGVVVYLAVSLRKIDDRFQKQQKQIDKIVQYIRFYDKLVFQLYSALQNKK